MLVTNIVTNMGRRKSHCAAVLLHCMGRPLPVLVLACVCTNVKSGRMGTGEQMGRRRRRAVSTLTTASHRKLLHIHSLHPFTAVPPALTVTVTTALAGEGCAAQPLAPHGVASACGGIREDRQGGWAVGSRSRRAACVLTLITHGLSLPPVYAAIPTGPSHSPPVPHLVLPSRQAVESHVFACIGRRHRGACCQLRLVVHQALQTHAVPLHTGRVGDCAPLQPRLVDAHRRLALQVGGKRELGGALGKRGLREAGACCAEAAALPAATHAFLQRHNPPHQATNHLTQDKRCGLPHPAASDGRRGHAMRQPNLQHSRLG